MFFLWGVVSLGAVWHHFRYCKDICPYAEKRQQRGNCQTPLMNLNGNISLFRDNFEIILILELWLFLASVCPPFFWRGFNVICRIRLSLRDTRTDKQIMLPFKLHWNNSNRKKHEFGLIVFNWLASKNLNSVIWCRPARSPVLACLVCLHECGLICCYCLSY